MRRISYVHLVGNTSLSSFSEDASNSITPDSNCGTNSTMTNGVSSEKNSSAGVLAVILDAVRVFGGCEFTLGCVRKELVGTVYEDISQNSLYWRLSDLVKNGKLILVRDGVYKR